MTRSVTQITVPAARMIAAAALLLRATRAATGAAPGRQPERPREYWPNPSSTEGGRPWPPAPPYW